VREAVEAAFHEEWGQVVATLIGLTGDWDLAEECASDAFASALTAWERDGVPRRPGRLAHDDRPQPRPGSPAPREGRRGEAA